MLSKSTVAATLPVRDLGAANSFYGKKLGLPLRHGSVDEGFLVFEAGKGTALLLFGSESEQKSDNAAATFEVSDLHEEMQALRERGVAFEEYDLPDCKTANGVADMGGHAMAWIKDPDGNILALHQTE